MDLLEQPEPKISLRPRIPLPNFFNRLCDSCWCVWLTKLKGEIDLQEMVLTNSIFTCKSIQL